MHINRLIERFLCESGLPPSKFGRLVARDPRLVLDMRLGRQIRPAMETKLREFMATHSRTANPIEREAA
jgi:hypothetical protein